MNYTFLKSKTGQIVPAINGLPLHSTVDPQREAQKLLSTVPQDTGFIIFLGLGGGFAPLAALEKSAQVTVIDYGIKDLFTLKDYSKLHILEDPKDNEIQSYILANYKPALHGGIKVIPLRTRTEHDKELFASAASAIQKAVESIAGDYAVQVHFGKRWFANIIRNISVITNEQLNDIKKFFSKNIKEAAVAAAGPSLDSQLRQLADLKKHGVFIICSDTALGALLGRGIEPDTIVSIDCQYKSYYHFLGYKPLIKKIPFVLDIASPPGLSGLTSSPVFFASGHPLARYIRDNYLPLANLDTSGGNVTYACYNLAEKLGAERITLFGADFAYVNSQSYARGAYVLPYFEERQNRFSTLEAQSSVFMYRSPFLDPAPGQVYRETTQLRFYRECLEKKAGVKIKPGSGVPILITRRTQSRRTKDSGDHGERIKSNISSFEFLKDYQDKIANSNDQNIITTMLPYAAFLKHRNPHLKTKDLLDKTKTCCINEIYRIIN